MSPRAPTRWNRLTLVPLSLLLAGAVLAVGVVLEFVVGGGLRSSPRELANAGWAAYLLGTAISAVGALVLAAATAGTRPAAAAAGQLVTGLAWAASARLRPEAPRGSAAAPPGRRPTPRPTGSSAPR